MRLRSVATVALGGVGAALLLAAILVAYVRLAVVDADGFLGRAEAVRQNPAVRAWLAQQIVRELERTASPDLIAARPLLEEVIAGALGSEAIRPIYEAAVRRLHRDLLSGARGGLLLNLTDAGIVVIGLLRARDPALAERIPLSLEAALIRFGELELPEHLVQPATTVSRAAPLLLLAALLFLGLAFALARDRWKALVAIAATVAGVGILIVLVVQIGGALLEGSTRGMAALHGTWWAFVGELRRWGLLLGATGLVLAGAAIGAANRVDLGVRIWRAGRWLVATPRSRLEGIARAVLLGLLGLAAVLRPNLVLHLFAMLFGALLLLRAVVELVLAVAPPERATRPQRHLASWVLGGLAILALLFVGLPRLFGPQAPSRQPVSVPGKCNGSASLCDRRLEQVTFAGTHNSMSDASQGWFIAAQDGSILEQLDKGVRALLFDVWWGAREGDHVRTDLSPVFSSLDELIASAGPDAVSAAQRVAGRLSFAPLDERELFLCHTLCELGATPLVAELRRMAEWLEENPGEVVLLFIEDAVPPMALAETFEQSGLARRVYRGPLGATLPTLGELVARGTTAIVLIESGTPGISWIHDGFALFQETPWENPDLEAFRCDEARGRRDSPLFLLNHWISRQPPSVTDARQANDYAVLLDHALRCEKERGLRPNIIAVDFFTEGALFEVVRKLNETAPGAPAPADASP